jgi:transposase/5-methylcytosine-specific restriction endonuclease McrA
MERGLLEGWIAEGRSVEEIARLVGKHPSTVSYWMQKYGLRSAHTAKHASRGGVERDELEALVERGLTVRQIADELALSATTVRHWLGRHGIETARMVRLRSLEEARASGQAIAIAVCPRHGETEFRRREGDAAYRCLQCRSDHVSDARRRRKARLVAEAGGCCAVCGYDRYVGALQFHHRDPATKLFALSRRGLARSLEEARAEASKCVLLCANCHAEVEAGVRQLVA